MAEHNQQEIEREHFHDDYWTAPKLWLLGAVTLGSALTLILWLSNVATRPM